MRLERSFNIQSPEAVSFRVSESTRTQNNNLETEVTPREIILFSRADGGLKPEDREEIPSLETVSEETPEPRKQNDWESFNTKPHPSQNFVNLYSGPFSQQMELNRKNAERLLQVAGIEGKVILADTPMDRSRSIAGVNPDGSVIGRRKLYWGEKIEDEDKSQSLVKSIPQGWRIEIPGQDILDELSSEKSKKPLDKRFVARFNHLLRPALNQVMIREKLTAEKDTQFLRKFLVSTAPLIIAPMEYLLSDKPYSLIYLSADVAGAIMFYVFANFVYGTAHFWQKKSIYEYFMPPIEIDRVLRGLTYLNIKGQNLTRLKKD